MSPALVNAIHDIGSAGGEAESCVNEESRVREGSSLMQLDAKPTMMPVMNAQFDRCIKQGSDKKYFLCRLEMLPC